MSFQPVEMRYNCAFSGAILRFHIALGALLALSTCLGHAQPYTMKDSAPPTGSMLKRDAAVSSYPLDKTYAQLSDEDKARLRSQYEHMGPDDEPPYPRRGYGSLMRSMHAVQRKVALEGTVEAGVIVAPDGTAAEVKVYNSNNAELTPYVANVLLLEKYKPALCQGKPCSQEFAFTATFELTH